MNINIGGWLLAIVFGIIATLAIKGCITEQGAHQRNDIALQAARQDSITVNKRIDSSFRVADHYKLQSDSLKGAIDQLTHERKGVSGELAKSKARVTDLIALIGTAKESGDKVGKLINCDSLVEENMNLIGLVSEYEAYTDSVERMHIESYKLRDSLDKERLRLIDALKSAYNRAASANISLMLKQATKKERRFSVGPAIGGGIGDGLKPTAFAGVTLTYSLFKF